MTNRTIADEAQRRRVFVLAQDSLQRKAQYLKLSPSCVKVMTELLRLSIESGSATVTVERKPVAKSINVSVLTLDGALSILERWGLIEQPFRGEGYRIRIYPWEGSW